MSERHTSVAAGLAQAQFTVLARRYGVDPAGHAALVASFQREWLHGYHQVLASAGGSAMSGTVDVVGARGPLPGGAGSRVGGMSIVGVVSAGDPTPVSDVSAASGAVFSPDPGSRNTDSSGFRDTGSISGVSVLDEPVGAGSGGLGEPAVAATGPAAHRIHDLASGGHGRASEVQLHRLAADIGIQTASPDGVLPRLFEVSRDIVMADTFSGVYFADPAAADPDAAAADRTAARALPRVRGWFTIAGHRNLAERLADDPVRQALFLRMLTASPAWRHAVAQARQRGGDTPDIMLVWCDAAWQAPGQATSFGEWLRTRLRARRLMSSTHQVDQIPGELRPHVNEPARSVLFSDASVELFGPDLVEAVRTADIVQNGQEPGVRWPDQQDFAAAGGRHRWAGNTSHGQSPDPAEGPDPSSPAPVSATQWMWDPTRNPAAQSPLPHPALEADHPPGEDLSWLNDGNTSPIPGPAPASPTGTSLPQLPGPWDDPDAPTTPAWPTGRAEWAEPAGWAEPGWPVPGTAATDEHGAAMSTDFGQPSIDDQADDGSRNLDDWAGDGGILGDWAIGQGPDMDWQPSLTPPPAVTHTDAGTIHTGDTLHHPTDEPPATPAPLHPDEHQPAAGSRQVRHPDEARALFDLHADHIATTTAQRDQLRQLWHALINHMDDNGTITASESDLAKATSAPQPTVHRRIRVLRGRGLLQRVQEARRGGAARYGVSDPGRPRQAPLPAPPEGSRWVHNPDEARALFDLHANHIATTTAQREPLRQLWHALIDRMDDNGTITATESDLATATSTLQQTVHRRMGVLRDRGLLQRVQEAHRGGAARYGVSDPGRPRQAPLPAPPEGSRRMHNPDEARALFDQHANHIATTTPRRDQLRQLWHALIDRMDDNGTITASEPDLATATSTLQPTVHDRMGVLRDRGLLQRVQEAHGRGAARYGVSDPGRPRQAPVPGPALGPHRPQGENLSWLDHGATAPIPGPAPASPTGTDLPQLPGPWDDPDAPTTSPHDPTDASTPAWPTGWAEPAEPMEWTEPGWLVPGTAATDEHGAAMSTDFGQPSIDDQADDGGNPGDWAIGQGPDMDWQPPLTVTRTDAGTIHTGDTPHHPTDEPPTTPAPLHPDQPQPTASSRQVRHPDEARALFDQHADHIATTTAQRDQLRQLWHALIDRMDDNGTITATESDLAKATSTLQSTVHRRIGVLRGRGLLQRVQEAHRGGAARYGVNDPGQLRQAPLPAPPEGSRWVCDPDEARVLFDLHAGHIAATTAQRDGLRQLWHALIDRMDDNGTITASLSDLAEATSTPRPTVQARIRVLRDRGLLQLVQEAHGHGAARYGVSDPGRPRQAPLPAPPEGSRWVHNPDEARALI
ncbi:hypothetical protein ACFY2R_29840, partial [Micromonospora olivasterospora]